MIAFWFKRDLRLTDNLALSQAWDCARSKNAPLVGFYLYEKSLWEDGHHSKRHWTFVRQSITDMNDRLKGQGSVLALEAEAPDFLQYLLRHHRLQGLFSHQESTLRQAWKRDQKVKALLENEGVSWVETPQIGILRGQGRKNWSSHWKKQVTAKTREFPSGFRFAELEGLDKKFSEAPKEMPRDDMQKGGESQAHLQLRRFLQAPSTRYLRSISKPALAEKNASRLSPYLSWGCLSARQVYQAHREGPLKKGFEARLAWRSHFVQKLEDEVEYAEKALNPAFETAYQKSSTLERLRFFRGRSGYPLIDACIRCLIKSGHVNFRTRATLVSFWCHLMNRDWRDLSKYLAQCFLDYDPGIHYPQMQMQAGSTGINTLRIYNPIKQSLENDPEATFISQWLPELSQLPLAYRHEPWKITPIEAELYGFRPGCDYPERMLDHIEAGKRARQKLWNIKTSSEARAQRKKILERHVETPFSTRAKN